MGGKGGGQIVYHKKMLSMLRRVFKKANNITTPLGVLQPIMETDCWYKMTKTYFCLFLFNQAVEILLFLNNLIEKKRKLNCSILFKVVVSKKIYIHICIYHW